MCLLLGVFVARCICCYVCLLLQSCLIARDVCGPLCVHAACKSTGHQWVQRGSHRRQSGGTCSALPQQVQDHGCQVSRTGCCRDVAPVAMANVG